jgi:hypothetical protein
MEQDVSAPVEQPTGKSDYEDKRRTFFRLLFGRKSGIICIATSEASKRETFKEHYFIWPGDEPKILSLVTSVENTHNVWYCPHMFFKPKRKKEYVAATPVAWADLDECNPDNLKIKPSIVIETSNGRWQALWNLQDETVDRPPVEPLEAQNISRRIAYFHADDGADRSGWDLTQLLRVPFTKNFKYSHKPTILVRTIDDHLIRYAPEHFDIYPEVADYTYSLLPFPSADNPIFTQDVKKLMQKKRMRLNPMTWELYNAEPKSSSWSEDLWKLMMSLFEVGFEPEEVFAIVKTAACNKFERDGRAEVYLWADVSRAYAKHARMVSAMPVAADVNSSSSPGDYAARTLLSQDEIKQVQDSKTFVEDYIGWASSLGDAAPQYHQAGAFVALSSILSGAVALPTSFGDIAPNLWFMILADTTLTRKTTSMDIATSVIQEVDPDILLATDGSIEGMMTSISLRPNRPSMFLRDEFSGLIDQMSKRDYMAGMMETLTKLYDGKEQKRVLRKEQIIIKNPRLVLYAGGIKDRVTMALTHEHISSGFVPRFVFICAEVDLTRIRPMGPPTSHSLDERARIINLLEDTAVHYQVQQVVNRNQVPTSINTIGDMVSFNSHAQKVTKAQMTDDAWVRYQTLEHTLTQAGHLSSMPETLTPVYDRLSKSILKCALLIAASRQRSDQLIVEEIDILRATYYGQSWKGYADEVVQNIGIGLDERIIVAIMEFLSHNKQVSRSEIMRRWRLYAKQAENILATMEQRMMIARVRKGKAELIVALTS